ncbi:peroxisome biogenesis protein 16-like isoform X2 [Chenopodium quinoa]|uniref:peroxisome biogenesis protein 16-like isoform X2 n=1 Tax=Chenopodium quinoa TaxID=63459 RepID=UPI000B773310|nr:peroxisome biogenesis protein 16-like isoform X2 [Chenopodium quinoa]
MEAYKNWVRQNKDYVHSLESLANGLTWLLPERFSASEIGPEAVTSILGILTAINEHIIETTPTPAQWRVPTSSSSSSFPFSLCISALKEAETLVEVVAQQLYGDDKKWNFILITEASKALLRLALFRDSGYKMLLHGGETPNIDDPPNPQNNPGDLAKPGGDLRPAYLNNQYVQNPWNREGKALAALNRFGENARMVYDPTWLRRTQQPGVITSTPTVVIERPTVSSILSEKGLCGGLFLMGETLFILRPLIYVWFIRKYGIRSWKPWLISLAVDLVSSSVSSLATKSKEGTNEQKETNLSVAEKDELRRRKVLWALYIMRDPFFCTYTRRRLESNQKVLEPIPVVGLLSEKLVDLIFGAQTRYTYMSGS